MKTLASLLAVAFLSSAAFAAEPATAPTGDKPATAAPAKEGKAKTEKKAAKKHKKGEKKDDKAAADKMK